MNFDFQDALVLIGCASLVGGVAMWSRPAALILFGLMCLGAVMLIQLGKREKPAARSLRGIEKRQAS